MRHCEQEVQSARAESRRAFSCVWTHVRLVCDPHTGCRIRISYRVRLHLPNGPSPRERGCSGEPRTAAVRHDEVTNGCPRPCGVRSVRAVFARARTLTLPQLLYHSSLAMRCSFAPSRAVRSRAAQRNLEAHYTLEAHNHILRLTTRDVCAAPRGLASAGRRGRRSARV